MGKIIKKSIDNIVVDKKKYKLGMKGEFKIEFATDSFGPYNYIFTREDCYFNDGLGDRGTKVFPLKNKKFDNTEIFLETDDIVIAVGERGSLVGEDKTFIDIINIKTEKKYRLVTDEVNLIYNTKDRIIINAKKEGIDTNIELDILTIQKLKEEYFQVYTFFKLYFVVEEKSWYLLDFTPDNIDQSDDELKYKKGYFTPIKLKLKGVPKVFKRDLFLIETLKGKIINIWDEINI